MPSGGVGYECSLPVSFAASKGYGGLAGRAVEEGFDRATMSDAFSVSVFWIQLKRRSRDQDLIVTTTFFYMLRATSSCKTHSSVSWRASDVCASSAKRIRVKPVNDVCCLTCLVVRHKQKLVHAHTKNSCASQPLLAAVSQRLLLHQQHEALERMIIRRMRDAACCVIREAPIAESAYRRCIERIHVDC